MLDWNGDGLSDLLITPTESPAIIYTNTSTAKGQWLTLDLIGKQSPRQPIGAIVELSTSVGARYRQLKGGGSYASTSSPDVHFGIPLNATVSEITIRWPSGLIQTIDSPTLNTRQCLIESVDR